MHHLTESEILAAKLTNLDFEKALQMILMVAKLETTNSDYIASRTIANGINLSSI